MPSLVTGLTSLVLALGVQSIASADPQHIDLPADGRRVIETLVKGASQRLSRPECRRLFTDFSDREGHALATNLDRSNRTAAGYLRDLYFVDASVSAQCRSGQPRIAFTAPGSRVVYWCGGRLRAYFNKRTSPGEILLIHELLHALGLRENPPTSEEITDRVWARCGDRE